MASTSEGSGVESAVAGVVAGGGSLTTRGNVTVTPINMTNASRSSCQFSYSANGVRISVPSEELRTHSSLPFDDEDSNDAEVSKIDFLQYQVNMRNKKKRPSSSVQANEAIQEGGERERPMSWEGELSDTEMVDALTEDGEDDSSHLKAESESESQDLTVKEEPVAPITFHGRDDRKVLNLKYAGVPQHSLHFHQRSLSMNRICVVTEGGAARRTSPDRGRPPSTAPPPVPATADGYQVKLEQHVLQQQQQQQQQQQTVVPELKCEPGALVEKLLGSLHGTPSGSPLLPRQPRVLSNASNDSAIHSMYTHSVYSSPSASPGASRHGASLSRNNSDASHSSCYSYSSEFSPTHSPVQGRHGVLFRDAGGLYPGSGSSADPSDTPSEPDHLHQGISRQQLINSPCPICGDKISGFHYGIFSCESCKGFFKRTVQNRKNYVCLRGANCPVTVATRKKCPACRFDKCLHCGMKLEAIREDRTRGGRSTYQCSYTLSGAASTGSLLAPALPAAALRHATSLTSVNGASTPHGAYGASRDNSGRGSHDQPLDRLTVPPLLQEIMDVEHLWQYNESELSRLKSGQASASAPSNPLLAGGPDFLANLCNIADHRLYKIVKWCKSLPLFKNISIDDQICLLINSWCELLVLSCCYRGVGTPGEVRVGSGRGITLHQSDKLGLSPCIERMLHFTDHLRRLRVDRYEYVALKVIVLLTSDALELKEPEKVRASQERALAALQAYTAAHYPDTPAKFGELLLRIPELQRTCQVGKEMLNPSNKSKDGEGSSFNLLMELLRGDH